MVVYVCARFQFRQTVWIQSLPPTGDALSHQLHNVIDETREAVNVAYRRATL